MAAEPLAMCYPAGWRHFEGRLTPRFRTIQVCPKDWPARLLQAGGAVYVRLEAARFRYASWRHGGVAAGGARAAIGRSADRAPRSDNATRAERSFVSQFAKSLFYFRRRRADRHRRTRDFAGTRRRVDADDRSRLDVDRGDRTGLDDRRRLNVERSRLDSAGGNCDRRRPDIRLARRHVGPTRLYADRRRTSVGEPWFDRRVIWYRPIGVDIGECGPGQGFRRCLAARLLLGHARIGLCVLARRQCLHVLRGLTRGLRDGRIGVLLQRRALLVDGSGRSRRGRFGAQALGGLDGDRTDLNSGRRRGSWRGRG